MKRKISLFVCQLIMISIFTSNVSAQLTNVPCTGFNNDIVAGGVGTNSVVGITYPLIGTDGARYTFIDNTFRYVSTNALPTCYMPVSGLAASMQTPGLTYQFQSYGAGTTLNNNALTIANQSTAYTSPFPSSASLSLVTPASFSKVYVLYETVSNIPTTGFTFDATVTFTDATTQSFPNNACVNWFTATLPAFNNVGRTSPTGNIECGLQPNFFELQMPLLAANYNKLVQSITFSIPTIMTTGAFPYSVNYFHAMAVGGLVPCNAPTAQPTAPSLSTFSTSQINGTFTAAAGSPTGYLVVRYPAGATEVLPANGTTYTTGQALGTGTVVQASASTTFNATGLSGSSTYDFYVYAYNGNTTCGGPIYMTTGGFIGTQTTNGCGTMSGVIPVGASAPASPNGFTSLTSAVAYINTNGLGAATILELQTDYDVLGETFPIIFATNPCVNATRPLTIRPAAGVAAPFVLSSLATSATIIFDGASYITIDGRNGGTGANKFISIINTSTTSGTSGNSILLKNDANNNVLTYLDVQSANGNAAINTAAITAGIIPGAIAIGTTIGVNGNDNNTISFCDIHSTGANLGVGIYAGNSTPAGSLTNNDNNIITDNTIYDFYLTATASAGIDIAVGNNNFTISNNKIYQTSTRTYTGTQAVRGIWVTPNTTSLTSASGFIITGNTIGYNSSAGTGTLTMTGTTGWLFDGLDLSLGTGTASSVQNNLITNINMTSGNTGSTAFLGINVANGNVNVGTITGNIIGSSIANGSITFTATANTGGLIGIRTGGGTTITISNNVVAGIDLLGSTTSISPIFNGIAASGGTTVNITNNTIGSAIIANSINASTASINTSIQSIRGIVVNGSATASMVMGNTVANINTNIVSTGTQATTLQGIAVLSPAGSCMVRNNLIRNLSSSTQTSSGGATAAIVGIAYTSTVAGATISGNTIHSLKLTSPSVTSAVVCQAIGYFGPSTGTNIIEKNNIHSISIGNTANSLGILTGMDIGGGLVSITNNMISLGYDENGNSVTAPLTVRGITNNSGTANIWFNNIYIGGTGVGVSAINTFCYAKTGGVISDVRNNIFENERSNATTGGKHYAVNLNNTTSLTLNYNDYYGTGTGYVFGYTGTLDVATYTSGWVTSDANSITGNPQFVNPNGNATNTDLHVNAALAPAIDQAGFAGLTNPPTDDFDGDIRANFTPVDMGADALTVLGAFANTPICEGNDLNLTAAPAGATSYSWTGPNGFSSSSQNPTITGATVAAAGTYTCVITVASVSTTATVAVVVNATPIVEITPDVSTLCGSGLVNLSQTGLTTYQWSTGEISVPQISVVPVATQTYSVSGTDANGCAGSDTVLITVNALPTVAINPTFAFVCPGNSTTLTQSGLTSFTWMPGGASSNSILVSPAATETYTVSGTDANGCSGSATAPVMVFPAPVVDITATTMSICNGTPTTLTQTGLLNFAWNPTGDTISSITVFPSTNTTYMVTGNDVNGCPGMDSITINVNSISVSISATDTSVCAGSSTTLTQSGLDVFTWDGGFGSSNSITDTPTGTTTYSVSGTSAGGCAGSATLTITIDALPTVSASASATLICSGAAEILTGGGAVSYSWDNGVTDGVVFNPIGTTTYIVTGTDANGCQNTASATVSINQLPTVTLDFAGAGINNVCNVFPYQYLTGGSPAGGIYSGSIVSNDTIYPNTLSLGYYTINYTYTDNNTCSNTASDSLLIDICFGVHQDENNTNIEIYPNPFTSQTTISFSKEQYNTIVSVRDVLGKEVKSITMNGEKNVMIEKGSMKEGIYFVEILDSTKNIVNKKIIIQ